MKITRRGARKDHGLSSIEFQEANITWIKTGSLINVRALHVRDFSTTAHHSYNVRITSQELVQILEALAAAAIDDPRAIEKEFAASLKPLVRLTNVVLGLHS